jgi:hypothetical protein
MAKRRHL